MLKLEKKRQHNLVLAINPTLTENAEELLNPQNKVFLNDVLNPVQRNFKNNEINTLISQIDRNLGLLQKEYQKLDAVTEVEFKKLDDRYNDLHERQLKNKDSLEDKKIDFSFLKENIVPF